jgi:hypothetical protein
MEDRQSGRVQTSMNRWGAMNVELRCLQVSWRTLSACSSNT